MDAVGARRTDRADRHIGAPPEHLWQAWADPAAMEQWMPPNGMTGRVDTLDLTEGGAFRMTLTYPEPGSGKTSPDTDTVVATFRRLSPPTRLGLDVTFVSDDAAYAGTMRMTWAFDPVPGGSDVSITCEDVPPGIGADDHIAALATTLDNLARHVAATDPST